ncbi:hypothetical protein ORV05_27620 [Amycolatopsis cynarae]|uniref:Uncharacterized protein n=1 Tax=Amycolatopsis cynarae TaxID=2995223 RepID=A0ABY7AYA7_9PSEU|nr:hypothetical protein [Amycolatopsis sp. HUAS 11-8]WAL64700.1 hypothetical protein ORV05_27620 [Amycolatopsis sp. HUAS 11-8]
MHQRITLAENNFTGLAQVVAAGQAFTLIGLGGGGEQRVEG